MQNIADDQEFHQITLKLCLVIYVGKGLIGHRLVQELAQRLPTLLHIEDQELFWRHGALHALDPSLEGLHRAFPVRPLHSREHRRLVEELRLLLEESATLPDPHRIVLLPAAPRPDGLNHAVIPLLRIPHRQ